jgi:hypothetical protein
MLAFFCRRAARMTFLVTAVATATVLTAGAGRAATLNAGPIQPLKPASGKSVSAATAPLTAATYVTGRYQDEFNGECLDGREGFGNVTLSACGNDGAHQDWAAPEDSTYGYVVNIFNSECLDGREGFGSVTLQPCYNDGTHEDWRLLDAG